MKFQVQLTLDARNVGSPVEVELHPHGQAHVVQAFGDLALELQNRAEAMFGSEHYFPMEATCIGATIKRL